MSFLFSDEGKSVLAAWAIRWFFTRRERFQTVPFLFSELAPNALSPIVMNLKENKFMTPAPSLSLELRRIFFKHKGHKGFHKEHYG